MKALFFSVYMTGSAALLSLQSPPIPPEFKLIIDVGKFIVWASIAISMWKMLKVAHGFYQTFNYIVAEYRHVVNISRDTHPERWGEFDSIIESNKPQNRKPKSA